MKSMIKGIFKKKFVRDVSIIASGTIMAQLITLIFMPIITRLYGPEAYGLMGTFMSILAIVIPIAALTYPVGIVLPKRSSEAIDISRISIRISVILSVFTFVFLLFFYKYLAKLLSIESIAGYLFLIPIVLVSASINQILRQWLIRENQFVIISKISIIESIIIYGGMVLLGLFLPVPTVLIIFVSIKNIVSAIYIIIILIKRKDRFFTLIKKRNNSLKTVIFKYREFPLYRAPQELINSISQSLPILILVSFFGPPAAGYYSIARSSLSIPSQFIGSAVGDVFYPRISKAANNNENLTKLIQQATISLFIIGLVPFGTVMILGPWIFSLVFGKGWHVAGEYARWISVWLLFMFINSPSIKALPVLSAQRYHLLHTVISLITRLVALYIGAHIFQSDIVAIALVSVSSAILNIILILNTLRISRKFDTKKNNCIQ